MATLSETLTALYAVQQLDTRVQRAKRLQSTLDNGSEATSQSVTARENAAGKRSIQHHVSGDLKDNELKLETVEAKRKSYQQKLYQGSSQTLKNWLISRKKLKRWDVRSPTWTSVFWS